MGATVRRRPGHRFRRPRPRRRVCRGRPLQDPSHDVFPAALPAAHVRPVLAAGDAGTGSRAAAQCRGQHLHRQQGRRQHLPRCVRSVRHDPGQPDRRALRRLALRRSADPRLRPFLPVRCRLLGAGRAGLGAAGDREYRSRRRVRYGRPEGVRPHSLWRALPARRRARPGRLLQGAADRLRRHRRRSDRTDPRCGRALHLFHLGRGPRAGQHRPGQRPPHGHRQHPERGRRPCRGRQAGDPELLRRPPVHHLVPPGVRSPVQGVRHLGRGRRRAGLAPWHGGRGQAQRCVAHLRPKQGPRGDRHLGDLARGCRGRAQ
ncbi:hypothetical protein NB705_001109 [Xanthomonas sacchari]|nr:hypothetical protein [Xanthomonas sacchari]